MMESEIRSRIVRLGEALYNRGYCPGSSGNVSVRLPDGFLMSPTNSRLGMLEPDRIAKLNAAGEHISGDKPSKEVIVHLAMYDANPTYGAVVHLHSPYSMALSCLQGLNPADALPPLTPYYIMRVGKLHVLPYFRPGDTALADAVGKAAVDDHALLLTQHGLIVAAKDFDTAVNVAEELEETARLYLTLKDQAYLELNDAQIADVRAHFSK